MKFRDMPYERVDYDRAEREIRALTDRVEDAKSPEEVWEVHQEYYRVYRDVADAMTIAHIRYDADVTDEFYQKEREYYDEIDPKLSNLMTAYQRAIYESPYRPYLEEKIGKVAFVSIENAMKSVDESIIGRARKKGLLQVCCHQLRDFSPDPRGRVDDTVFGGGKGMLLQAEPFARGIDQICAHLGWRPHILYMSPRGKVLTQEDAKRLAQEPGLVLLCGHYEGVDQRLLDEYQVEEISIGDYVLTGGELGAMVLVDSVARLCPGVLPSEECYENESHMNGLLEYPQYTRPEEWEGMRVPEVLLSGHHANIERWRMEQSVERTMKKRPDLLK